jgi:hypothetical protein
MTLLRGLAKLSGNDGGEAGALPALLGPASKVSGRAQVAQRLHARPSARLRIARRTVLLKLTKG